MGFGSDTAAVVVDTSICAGAKVAAAGACACRCCVVPAVLIASERRMIMLGWSLLSPSRREAPPLLCPGCRSMVLTEKCMMSMRIEREMSEPSGVGWNAGGATKRRVLLAALAGAGSSRHSPPQKMELSMVTVEQLRSYYDCKAGR